eukprot:14775225-Heterocapsa_arctica.AAC.1
MKLRCLHDHVQEDSPDEELVQNIAHREVAAGHRDHAHAAHLNYSIQSLEVELAVLQLRILQHQVALSP